MTPLDPATSPEEGNQLFQQMEQIFPPRQTQICAADFPKLPQVSLTPTILDIASARSRMRSESRSIPLATAGKL